MGAVVLAVSHCKQAADIARNCASKEGGLMVPLSYYLVLSGFLFACGVTGFLIKRNIITIFMSIELMLNGVNLSFVAFAAHWHALAGQDFRLLRHGGRCGRSGRRIGHYHRRLPHARNAERRPGESAQTMTSYSQSLADSDPAPGGRGHQRLAREEVFAHRGQRHRIVFLRRGLRRGRSRLPGAFHPSTFPTQEYIAHWIRFGKLGTASAFTADFAFYLDQLSLIMLLVVTGVGFLIHIYSVGYMWDDPSYYRFFAYLNLFMFFMLTLVLASNYLLMFIGWEGVGLASYLLIGFWFTKDSAASAGKKAFIVNRIGDFGFLIALFLIIEHFGSLDFT